MAINIKTNESLIQKPIPDKNTIVQSLRKSEIWYNSALSTGFIHCINLYIKVSIKIFRIFNNSRDLQFLKSQKNNILKFRETGPRIFIEEIGLTEELDKNIYADVKNSPEYILGEFDQDGYILPNLIPIYSFPTTDKEHFLSRKKFRIFLVSVYGCLGVKKDYRGDTISFINELKIYSKLLGKKINIPAILDVNYDCLSITFSYIKGPTIRESLYNIGAVILDRDVEAKPELNKIPDEKRWLIQTDNKSESLYSLIDHQFVENLLDEVKKIHNCDINIYDVKYGNIIIEALSKKPYLIDFESSRDLSSFGKHIKKIQKEQDLDIFHNLFFMENN